MSKTVSDRVTVRKSALIEQFIKRFRAALAETETAQVAIAAETGFRNETISRLVRGVSITVPIDFLVSLAGWLDEKGISVRWLVTGIGPMRKADMGGPSNAPAYLDIMAYSMLLILARRAGVDITGVMKAWTRKVGLPGGDLIEVPLESILDVYEESVRQTAPPPAPTAKAARSDAPPPGRAPRYRTVLAEDIPSTSDWWKRYVPILGTIAAGEGPDLLEPTEYPPAWGEFLVYSGATQTAVAIRISGESMAPDFRDHDMVVVDPARPAESGICCVLIDRDGGRDVHLKRLHLSRNTARLESINSEFPTVQIDRSRLIAAFTVIAHLPA